MPSREAAGTTTGFANRAGHDIGLRRVEVRRTFQSRCRCRYEAVTKLVDLPPPAFERITSEKPTWYYRFMCRAAQISERQGGEEQAKRGEWVKRYGCCR